MATNTVVEPASPDDVRDHADEVVHLYQAVFTGPPWNENATDVAAFAARLPDLTRQPGFTAAWSRHGPNLTGIAVGHSTSRPFPTGRAYDRVRDLLGPAVNNLCDAMEIVELAVHPTQRSRGLGRTLLTAISSARPAWLLTATRITTTVAFYHHAGWHTLATGNGLTVFTNTTPGHQP